MSSIATLNGVQYIVPAYNDTGWAQGAGNLSLYLAAIAANTLQPTGGAFTLTADVDFGTNFGLISTYFKSKTANIAGTGTVRLAHADIIAWRDNANSANYPLGIDSSNRLTWNNTPVALNTLTSAHIFVGNGSNVATDVAMTGDIGITNAGVTAIQTGVVTNAMVNTSAAIAYSKLTLTGSIVNADIGSSAAIAYSKLTLTGAIVNADIGSAAAIAYSKLSLSASIVNADIASAAAIAVNKLAALTATRVVTSDGSGFLSVSTVTPTTLAFLDATSSVQTQLNAKQATLTAGQLPGTATSDDAGAGKVGQVVTSAPTITSCGTSGQYVNAASISLTAGDWDITFYVNYIGNGATVSLLRGGISTDATANSFSDSDPSVNFYSMDVNLTGQTYVGIPRVRASLSGTTTYYMKVRADYTVATPQYRGNITARRMR